MIPWCSDPIKDCYHNKWPNKAGDVDCMKGLELGQLPQQVIKCPARPQTIGYA